MKNKLLSVVTIFFVMLVSGQNSPTCKLDNVGLFMWLGDGDSQSLGDATNDDEDNDDYIAFKNYGNTAVDISGWQLFTDRYSAVNGTSIPAITIPASTTLLPGQYFLIVSDWNPGPAIPNLWFEANFTTGGEGLFEETSPNNAYAILRNPVSNTYMTVHQQGSGSAGQSLPGSFGASKLCNVNVTSLVPGDFDGCQTVYYNQSTGNYVTQTDCSLPLLNDPCGSIGLMSPPMNNATIISTCPASTVNLNTNHTATVPAGSNLVWFTNQSHTGTAYNTPAAATANTYYAFYFYTASSCYSAPSQAVTAVITPCVDSDGDGIDNSVDLDDDNDGILDSVECNSTAQRFTTTNFPNSGGGNSNITAVTGWNLDGVNGTNPLYSQSSTAIQFFSDNVVQSISQPLNKVYANTSGARPISINLTLNNSGSASNASSLILSYGTTGTETMYATLTTTTGTGTVGTITYANGASGIQNTFNLGTNFTLILNLPSTVPVSGNFKLSFDPSGRTISGGVPQKSSDDINLFSVSFQSCNDTDTDGIPDLLDLDTDNDGCVDAIEGDENIGSGQLLSAVTGLSVGTGSTAQNQNLGTTVDTNGVPQVVNSGGVADIGGDQGQGVGSSANAVINSCVCYNNPNISGVASPTQHGITLLQRAGGASNWPMLRTGAFTVLESNTKGFVITRMTTIQVSAIVSPQEGMMVYDTNLACLKIFDGTAWSCFNTPACP